MYQEELNELVREIALSQGVNLPAYFTIRDIFVKQKATAISGDGKQLQVITEVEIVTIGTQELK